MCVPCWSCWSPAFKPSCQVPKNPTSKKSRRSRKKGVVKDLSPEEVAKKEERTLRRGLERKLQIARLYLAKLRVHAHGWLQKHSKAAVLKGAAECALGGWRELLILLVDPGCKELPETCDICRKMFCGTDFNMEEFKRLIAAGKMPRSKSEQKPVESLVEAQERSEPPAVENLDPEPAAPPVARKGFSVTKEVESRPYLKLLEPNTNKCRLPIQCLLCIRKGTGKPAIWDGHSDSKKKYFFQHIDSCTHQRNLAVFKAENSASEKMIKEEAVSCSGFCPESAPKTKLGKLLAEFKLWSAYNCINRSKEALNGNNGTSHQYSLSLTKDEHTIFHNDCKKVGVPQAAGGWAEDRPMCYKCQSLGHEKSMIRMVSKFFCEACCSPSFG